MKTGKKREEEPLTFLGLVRNKNVLDFQLKLPGDLEGEGQAGIVALIFNRVDGLAADVEQVAELFLRKSLLFAQQLQLVFQSSLRFDQTLPTP